MGRLGHDFRQLVDTFTVLRAPRLSTIGRYGMIPFATALAFAVQYALLPEPSIAPFVFFHVSVLLAAWLGGGVPGLLTVALSALVGNFFFVVPFQGWAKSGPAITATTLFSASGSAVALLATAFRAAAFRSERVAETLRRQVELVQLSHDAVIVRRPDGLIEDWNSGAEELYGFHESEVRGKSLTKLLHTRFPQPAEEIAAVLGERQRWEGELVQRAKDGRRLTVSAKLLRLRGSEGPEHILESHNDITARIEAERALREADERKDEFLAVLSHELRNPLTPILHGLSVLDRVPDDSERRARAKAIIDRQVHQLTRLVEDLLDVTRIQRGKLQVARECFDLEPVVRRTIEDHLPGFAERGVELRAETNGVPLWVRGDEARLVQVIGNLLSNAASFSRRGGHVWVKLEGDRAHHQAVLRVRDDGMGVDPALLGRMFRPFEQAPRGTNRGLGLGLSIVKGLVEQHGGQVHAHSEGEGNGCEITVRLPLERPMRTAPASPGEELAPPMHLLLIEDDVDVAEGLREALTLDEHRVTVAHDGPEGLAKARALRPDVIICDIGLPRMDGFQVAETLREDSELREIALVALTGHALPADVERARAAGFDRHLAKPASIAALRRVLREVTAPRR